MSKKYVPSGYQIINLNMYGKTSGTAFSVETEDEKLLLKLISTGDLYKKPVLLEIESANAHILGFAVIEGDSIYIQTPTFIEKVELSTDTELLWIETEL